MKYYILEVNIHYRRARIINVVDNELEGTEIVLKKLSKNSDNCITYWRVDTENLIDVFKMALQRQPFDITLPI